MPRTRAEVGTFGGWRQCPEFVKFFIRGDRGEPLWPYCALHRSIQPLAPENVLLHLSSYASTTSLQNFLLCICLPLAFAVSQWNEKLIPIIALKPCHLSFPFGVVLKPKKNGRTCRPNSRVADIYCNSFSPLLCSVCRLFERGLSSDALWTIRTTSFARHSTCQLKLEATGLAWLLRGFLKIKSASAVLHFSCQRRKIFLKKSNTLEFLAIIGLPCLRFLLIKCWSSSTNLQEEVSRVGLRFMLVRNGLYK